MAGKSKKETENNLLVELGELATGHNLIAPDQYERYDVKRGLRNRDGTGVLVGLTEIGNVHGYIVSEKEKIPVDGVLLYRGINVESLVRGFQKEGRFGFEEVCYLLLFGELPNAERLKAFQDLLDRRRNLPDGFTENMILKSPSQDIMNKLARSVLAAYSYDPNPDDIGVANVLRQCIELIARFPTLTAYGYQAKSHYHDGRSLYLHSPDPGLSTSENFLRMIRPTAEYTRLEAEVLDLALILHAEHGGGNNSAFTAHVVTSSDTDTYSAIASAVGALKGPKHGGANVRVQGMVDALREEVQDWNNDGPVADYLVRILKKEAFDRSGLIYGMGHAVYTKSDPRAVILKRKAGELAKDKDRYEEYLLYDRIERLAPRLLKQHKHYVGPLCANVDLYAGLVYNLLGISQDLYTPIFATARIAGWCAHRIEELVSGGRIIRPAYKNVVGVRKYVPLKRRRSSQTRQP